METKDYLDFSYHKMSPKKRLELDIGNIYDNKIECKKCGWIVRSKNRHHMAYCKCGAVAVDGGSWYVKTLGSLDDIIFHTVYFKYKHK